MPPVNVKVNLTYRRLVRALTPFERFEQTREQQFLPITGISFGGKNLTTPRAGGLSIAEKLARAAQIQTRLRRVSPVDTGFLRASIRVFWPAANRLLKIRMPEYGWDLNDGLQSFKHLRWVDKVISPYEYQRESTYVGKSLPRVTRLKKLAARVKAANKTKRQPKRGSRTVKRQATTPPQGVTGRAFVPAGQRRTAQVARASKLASQARGLRPATPRAITFTPQAYRYI